VCDVDERDDLERALDGVDAVFYLVHAMGGGAHDYAETERRGAALLRDAAARAGVKRIVYLGGVAPAAEPSEHLKSRLAVGEVLREMPERFWNAEKWLMTVSDARRIPLFTLKFEAAPAPARS